MLHIYVYINICVHVTYISIYIHIYKHTGFERRVVVELQSCFIDFQFFKIMLRKQSVFLQAGTTRTLDPSGEMERRGRAQGGGPLRLWGSSGPRTRMNPSKETALPGDLGTGDRQALLATRPVSGGR